MPFALIVLMRNLKVIILAAGKGTRMKSDTPKVLHGVCGKPIIDYVVDVAKAISQEIFVVLGHKGKDVEKHLAIRGVKSVYQKKLLGTADAVKSCEKVLRGYKGNVVVLSGDAPLAQKETLKRLLRKHAQSKATCTLLTAKLDNPRGYGRIVRDQKKNIIAICEEKDATFSEKAINEINAGVYCFKAPELVKALKAVKLNSKKKEFYLTDIIAIFVQEKKRVSSVLAGVPHEVLGINTREHLSIVGAILREKILKKLMSQGVTIVDPQTAYVDANVKIGRDTIIHPCVVIEKDVVIGKKCTIGPFCHLRPKTRIKDKAHVGNFSEVSRSEIGEGSIVKHFSFLGDAKIGKRVNIGAGTVTANYDGKNKNVTRIADQAFIGSDSILVAPVTVGKKAMTGAGCVVTKGKNVPAGHVAVGVPAKIKKAKGKANG